MTPTDSEGASDRLRTRPAFSGSIDVDVHHGTLDVESAFSSRLPKVYQERLVDYAFPLARGPFAEDGGDRGWRGDLLGGEVPRKRIPGGAAGWDPKETARFLFEEDGLDGAVLTGGAMDGVQSMPDVDYGGALCRAFNDWTLETWLECDSRYRFAMAILTQDPPSAVAEIDRIGDDPRICGVLMPTGSTRPFGHRTFDPIYEALERHNLPMILHRGGDAAGVFGDFRTGTGTPSYFAELVVAQPAVGEVHLESLIFEAVFQRHPSLRVLILGIGFAWLPSYLWRMDLDWKGLRWHTPWVEKLPSEYVSEHVWFGTGPWVQVPSGPFRDPLWGWVEADRSLVYASGYPRWDADRLHEVRAGLPETLWGAVEGDSARKVLRL